MNKVAWRKERDGRASDEAHGRDDLLPRLIDGHSLVRSGCEMGLLLWTASPTRARCFALDSHERACERGDDDLTAFWRETLEWLSDREAGPEGVTV